MISKDMDRPTTKRMYYQMKRLSKCFETVLIRQDGSVLCEKILGTILPYGRHYAVLLNSIFSSLLEEGEWIRLRPLDIIDPIKKDANLKLVSRLYWEEDQLMMQFITGDSHVIGKRVDSFNPKLLDYLSLMERKSVPKILTEKQMETAMERKLEMDIDGQNIDYSKFLTPGLNLKESQVFHYPIDMIETLSRVCDAPLNPNFVQPWVFEHHRHETVLFHLYLYIRTIAKPTTP